MADVGLLMAYWPDREQADIALGQPANLAPGFPTREELAARYGQALRAATSPTSPSSSPSATEAGDHPRGRLRPLRPRWLRKVDDGIQAFARLVERLAEAAVRGRAAGTELTSSLRL